jgi:L-ascorbate metabolism protein UlaG (beta-lactamase superfamily)
MKIQKFGHCCFIAEPKPGIKIMTDPGSFSTTQNTATGITAVAITHEHGDHFHIDSLKEVLKNNPSAIVITNTAVGKLLTEAGIAFTKVEEGETYDLQGVTIAGFGNTHAEIYGDYGQVQNTGYMIDALCYPGDAFHYPDATVDILALPIAGPWMKVKESIDYAKKLNPRIAFAVHDAIVSDKSSFIYSMTEHFLSTFNVSFKKLELGKEEEV